MYLGTHCNIGSKRAFPTGVQVTELFTYLPTQRRTACYAARQRRFDYFCVMTQKKVKGSDRRIFCALIALKSYVPHQNSPTKGTSLGCLLVPEMIRISRNCAVWAPLPPLFKSVSVGDRGYVQELELVHATQFRDRVYRYWKQPINVWIQAVDQWRSSRLDSPFYKETRWSQTRRICRAAPAKSTQPWIAEIAHLLNLVIQNRFWFGSFKFWGFLLLYLPLEATHINYIRHTVLASEVDFLPIA